MTEEEFQAALENLRQDWGHVTIDPVSPGTLRAAKDETAGIIVGRRAPLFAEIINRALDARKG